jgi:hypothetical protein
MRLSRSVADGAGSAVKRSAKKPSVSEPARAAARPRIVPTDRGPAGKRCSW